MTDLTDAIASGETDACTGACAAADEIRATIAIAIEAKERLNLKIRILTFVRDCPARSRASFEEMF